MLSVFHPTVAAAPEGIAAQDDDKDSAAGSAGAVVKEYKKAHPGAITVEFGKKCAMAYSHDHQELLRPRYLAVVDDIFCMFVGSLDNLSQLRQEYGVKYLGTESALVIEMYKALRDRSPYSTDHALRGLSGAFTFVLFDNTTQSILVAADPDGKAQFFWATASDGSMAFSDEEAILRQVCHKTFTKFPAGCFFSSADGLLSYVHPTAPVTAVPRVDSQGQVCGATFNVQEPDATEKHTARSASFPRVGSEVWEN